MEYKCENCSNLSKTINDGAYTGYLCDKGWIPFEHTRCKNYKPYLAFTEKEWEYIDKYMPWLSQGVERIYLPKVFKSNEKESDTNE